MKKIILLAVAALLLAAMHKPVLIYAQTNLTIPGENGQNEQLYNQSHALVIGVINYNNGWPALNGVSKDVEAVKQILEKQGFEVTVVLDPDHTQLDEVYRSFINKFGMDPENRLLLYFAGHGHTIKTSYGEEMGYIVPVDAPNPNVDKAGFLTRALTMQQIEVYAKQIQSKHAMFLFDACFSGSIFAISRAAPENISYKTAKPVRQFITSGSADETVPDESVFRQQFVMGLEGEADLNRDGYITGTELGEFLTDKVINYSHNSQHPQYGKIRNPHLDKGDFVFVNEESIAAANSIYPTENAATRGASADRMKTIDEKSLKKIELPWADEFEDMTSIFSKVALRTVNGNYVCAEKGGGSSISAESEELGIGEMFYVVPLGDKKIALKSKKGFYLSAGAFDQSGNLVGPANAVSNKIGPLETFEVVELEGSKIALRTKYGTYLSANRGGGSDILSNREKVKTWEVFDLIKLRKAALKSFNGQYLRAENGGGGDVRFDRIEAEKHESFEFVKINKNKIALKTYNGNYISIDEKASTAQNSKYGSNEIFELLELGNNKIALKSSNGKYISAVGGGGFGLRADAAEIGDWQTFELTTMVPKE